MGRPSLSQNDAQKRAIVKKKKRDGVEIKCFRKNIGPEGVSLLGREVK